ncbi:MAG: 50S ribosomal protein L3 [Calditrichia bacterium]|nr:50S ribosomal protein L3 [Calditrichia bacterium]
MAGLLGKKIGMTRIFDDEGNTVPVTVLHLGPCFVTQIKTEEKDGYEAVQIGFDEKKPKNLNKTLLGHLNKAGVPPLRFLKEFRNFSDTELKIGDEIKADLFKPGDVVKVTGTSKGRGFAGVVKRHNFRGGPMTHGQSDRLRAPGSIGQSSNPSRVFKGVRMAGQMGNKQKSVLNLRVVKVDSEKNLLFIKGAIPGARNSYVEVYQS